MCTLFLFFQTHYFGEGGNTLLPFVILPNEMLSWFFLSSTFFKLFCLTTQPAENKHVASTLGTIENVCKPCKRQPSHTLCLLFNDKTTVLKNYGSFYSTLK